MEGQEMLEALRKALDEKVKGLAALKDAATTENATEEAIKAFDDAVKDIEADEAKIKRLEAAEEIEKRNAQPASDPVGGAQTRSTPARAIEKLTTMDKIGIATAGLVRSNANGLGKSWRAAADQMDKEGYGAIAIELDTVQRSLNSGTDSAGGFAIGEDFNDEIFDELKPYTAFLRGSLDRMPMPRGNYRQSGVASRPSVGYRAEGAAITVSEPTLREIDMSAKLLGGIVPLTAQINEWTLERAGQKARQTLAFEMGRHMDAAAFEGTGVGNNPLGLFNVADITTFAAAAGTAPNVGVIDNEVRKLINVAESFAGLQLGLAWVMPQRVIGYLQDLRDGNNNLIFPTMQGDNPTFKGYPVLKTGTITTNAGAGTNETTISLISFGNILFGESGGLRIAVSEEGSYDPGTGLVSAFQNELVLLRATMEHDWTPRYSEAVGTLTGVQWGA